MNPVEEWLKLDPSMKKCWIIKGFFGSSIMLLFFIFPILFSVGPLAIIIYLILVGIINSIIIIWSIMFYNRYKYKIDEESVVIKRGILWKKDTTIPYERIQHVSTTRGPIEQLFNLHILNIFTAGTGSLGGGYGSFGSMGMFSAEGYIPGVKNPEKITEIIMKRVKMSKSESGLGDKIIDIADDKKGIKSENAEMLTELKRIRKILEKS